MQHNSRLPVVLLLTLTALVGCKDKEDGSDTSTWGGGDGGDGADGDGSGGDGGDGGGGVDCGSTAPEITGLTISNAGLVDVDGVDTPSVTALINAQDIDGDLHEFIVDVYMDQTIDGEVADDISVFDPVSGSADGVPCEVDLLNLNMGLSFTAGSGITYGAPAEFGVYVYDAKGNLSNYFIAEGCIPMEDGTDGCTE